MHAISFQVQNSSPIFSYTYSQLESLKVEHKIYSICLRLYSDKRTESNIIRYFVRVFIIFIFI